MHRIAVVCLGNICRSPMAAAVLRSKVSAAGLADDVEVTSAGTGDWHIGAAADRRARAALVSRGYPDDHRARQFTAADFADVDLVLAMDSDNLRALRRLASAVDAEKIRLFDGPAEVPDPYYGGRSDFEEVLDQIEIACDRLVAELRATVRPGVIPAGLAEALGATATAATPVGGGDICRAYRVRLDNGGTVFVKTRPGAPADFFRTEARGLETLAAAGGAPVPRVLAVTDEGLALDWVEPGRPTPRAAEAFGVALAATHSCRPPRFGGDGDGYLGSLRLPNGPSASWPELYADQRVEPALRVAVERGRISVADAAAVQAVLAVLPELAGPAEPPALLHGDLWSGNVLWAASGQAYLIDPAVHGGHRETDLAMLALFGAPHLDRILAAYDAVYPLADGWRSRVALHQLHPVVVHAALFGGGYGGQAGALARSALGTR